MTAKWPKNDHRIKPWIDLDRILSTTEPVSIWQWSGYNLRRNLALWGCNCQILGPTPEKVKSQWNHTSLQIWLHERQVEAVATKYLWMTSIRFISITSLTPFRQLHGRCSHPSSAENVALVNRTLAKNRKKNLIAALNHCLRPLKMTKLHVTARILG
jgi:hypothetical protein